MTDIVERLRRLAIDLESGLDADDIPPGFDQVPLEAGRIIMEQRAEIERLRAALQRIDGINDNPAIYNPDIEAVLRAALDEQVAQ